MCTTLSVPAEISVVEGKPKETTHEVKKASHKKTNTPNVPTRKKAAKRHPILHIGIFLKIYQGWGGRHWTAILALTEIV